MGQWELLQEQDISKRGCNSSFLSSCLKAEAEIKDSGKEVKEVEGQEGKKIGQVFSTCLLAEQSCFWEALGRLKQKQPKTCSPWNTVALGGCCWCADCTQVLVGSDDGERIPEAAFTPCPDQDTPCVPAGKVMSKFQGSNIHSGCFLKAPPSSPPQSQRFHCQQAIPTPSAATRSSGMRHTRCWS